MSQRRHAWAPPLLVGLLSAATLAYEVLLVRVFAIQYFQHFAHMAIGVAMLGFGAAGTWLALARPGGAGARWAARAALLAPWALLAGPALAQRAALDPTQLLWDGGQWLRLGAVYLALALPLAVTSLAILLALVSEASRVGRIYGASFLGSGLGALASVGLLWLLPPQQTLAAPAVLAALAVFAGGPGRSAGFVTKLGLLAAVAAGLLAMARPPWALEVSPYKGLPQVEAFPGARRVAERTSPLGWTVAIQAPSFRHAPGLSLAYRGRFPEQTGLFVDGETVGATMVARDPAPVALLDGLPAALPYALAGRERVLLLGAAGDLEARTALTHGARRIVAVAPDPNVVELSRRALPDPRVTWVVDDPRSFIAGTREEFDLVALDFGGGIGGSSAGVHALSENFMHTVEAYAVCLRRLRAHGVLAVSCWLTPPPRESVRLILTAAQAVRRVRPGAVPRALVVCRSWGTVTVLVKPAGFDGVELTALRAWAGDRGFVLDWPEEHAAAPASPRGGETAPGTAAGPGAARGASDTRVLLAALRATVAGADSAVRFARAYPFAVAPAVDARPYPQRFLRGGSIAQFVRGDLGRWLPFAEWGYVALIATLAQSILLAGILMLVPVAFRRRDRQGPRSPATIGYFAAIGLGYMATEIAAVPPLSLVLGHPVYAVAAVLATLLVFSGLGSAWSDRLAPARGRTAATLVALGLAAGAASLWPLAHVLESAALPLRVAAVLAALAPLGVLMGMPFPLGLRALARDEGAVAWAWAANGFASVVAAPLAAWIAVEAGTNAVLLVAAAAYATAATIHYAAGARRHG